MVASRLIVVSVRAVDGFRQTRRFRTLAGAQAYAQRAVSACPEVSWACGYAVSPDGVVKVEVDGATLGDLFPGAATPWEDE